MVTERVPPRDVAVFQPDTFSFFFFIFSFTSLVSIFLLPNIAVKFTSFLFFFSSVLSSGTGFEFVVVAIDAAVLGLSESGVRPASLSILSLPASTAPWQRWPGAFSSSVPYMTATLEKGLPVFFPRLPLCSSLRSRPQYLKDTLGSEDFIDRKSVV